MLDAAPYYCSAFGIKILSDLDLGAIPAGEPPEVIFRVGTVPSALEQPLFSGVLFQARPGSFLLKLDNIGRYLVTGGNQIDIEPAVSAHAATVRLFLLGSPLAALLYQRDLLPLHASAVLTPKGAVILAGASGSGKSTLAAALHLRGYPVLSDEICAVTVGESFSVLPAFPSLMLWEDAVEALDLTGQQLKRVRPGIQKFSLPLRDSFYRTPAPIHRIYVIESSFHADLDVTPLTGLFKIRALANAGYHPNIARSMNLRERYFAQMTALGATVSAALLSRPERVSPSQVADLLEKDFAA